MRIHSLLAAGAIAFLSGAAYAEELNPNGLTVARLMLDDDIKASLGGGRAFLSTGEALDFSGSDVVTTANVYAQTFEDNELAADKQFSGKRIVVNGVVKNISKDAFGNPYLSLAGKNQFSDVIARLKPEAVDMALTIKKGASVRLTCKAGTKVLTSASLTNCLFLDQTLAALAPTHDRLIKEFLSGTQTFPKSAGEAVVFGYLIGSALPDNSPCLTATPKCNDEIKRAFPTKDSYKKVDDMLAKLKTK